jgi:hypothetical protein
MTAASVAGGRRRNALVPTPEANSEGHHLSDSPTDYTISFVAEGKQFALEGTAPVHPARVRS